MGKDEN
jgi:hypothetical protein